MSRDDRVMAVPLVLRTGPAAVIVGTLAGLFRTAATNTFIASADGQRFLVDAPVGETSVPSITVLLNWHGGR